MQSSDLWRHNVGEMGVLRWKKSERHLYASWNSPPLWIGSPYPLIMRSDGCVIPERNNLWDLASEKLGHQDSWNQNEVTFQCMHGPNHHCTFYEMFTMFSKSTSDDTIRPNNCALPSKCNALPWDFQGACVGVVAMRTTLQRTRLRSHDMWLLLRLRCF